MDFEVNKKLVPIKGHYFLWNAGTAPVVPFMSVYARQLGFSSIIVGIIYTILPIAGMLAKPLMGALADRYRCQKLIFLVMQLVSAVAFLAIFYVPELPVDAKVHFACNDGVAGFDTCLVNNSESLERIIAPMKNSTLTCDLSCPITESRHWNTICEHWKVSKYCSAHPQSLQLRTNSKIDYIGQCIYFEIESASIDGDEYRLLCPSVQQKIFSVCDVRNCNSTTVTELLSKSQINDEDVMNYFQFWLFLTLMLIAWLGQAVVVSVGDAICFELLGDDPSKYGRQRSFGALGWGLFSILSGYMVDSFSDGGAKKNYLPVFYLAFGVILVDFAVSCKIKYVQKNLSTSILRDIGKLLTNTRIVVFMVWCVAIGMCTGLIWQFLFWLLEDLAAAHSTDSQSWVKTLEGIVMAVQCLGGELPFFFLSGWILKRIGHVYTMSLILLAIGIRYILYSVVTNPWWVLPIELSNGVTFGLFYASMASYASIIAPPGTATTVQGLVGAVFEGVGVSLGSFLGGILYNAYGGPMTFRIYGIGALIACLVHAFVQYLIQQKDMSKDSLAYAAPQDAISMVADDYQELRLVD